jgi:hypothetical protein
MYQNMSLDISNHVDAVLDGAMTGSTFNIAMSLTCFCNVDVVQCTSITDQASCGPFDSDGR